MKIGMRTPSPTRSLKARTTGRVKRMAKKAINPVYGRKGMGYLKNPERAVKNHIYHKVTVDPLEPMKDAKMPDINVPISEQPQRYTAIEGILALVCLISGIYTIIMLFFYRELHLRPLTICAVSLILVFIIGRLRK